MKKVAFFAAATVLGLVMACAPAESRYARDFAGSTAALNQMAKQKLGISLRALGLVQEAYDGSYSLKSSLVATGAWESLQELESAGLARVSTVRGLPNGAEPESEFVTVELTQSGVELKAALGEL